jgi:hypothetical protein
MSTKVYGVIMAILWLSVPQEKTIGGKTVGESGNPGQGLCGCAWTPAFAGATSNTLILSVPFWVRH